jgi:hypothetical protein
MYFVFDRSRRMTMVVADNPTPDRKHVSLELARLTAIASDADLVCHRTEAWMVVGETPPGIAPSESDRRREVVLVMCVARDEGGATTCRHTIREIVRGADGAATGTRPLEISEGDGDLGGPLMDLLPPDPPAPAERRAARAIIERAAKRMARGKSAFVSH